MMVLAVVLIVVGWTLAGVFFGLWRGQRQIATHLEWLLRGAPGTGEGRQEEPGAVVRRPIEDEEIVTEVEIAELSAHVFEEAIAEGRTISEADAREEAERMIKELNLEAVR